MSFFTRKIDEVAKVLTKQSDILEDIIEDADDAMYRRTEAAADLVEEARLIDIERRRALAVRAQVEAILAGTQEAAAA